MLSVGIAVSCVTFVVLAAGDVHGVLGDTDPGRTASWLFGLVRFTAEAGAVVAVGALAFAVFVVPAGRARGLTADAYAAVRVAAGAATAWAVASVVAVPLAAGDASGQPPGVVWAHPGELVAATEEPKAWLCSAVVASVVAVGARSTLTWPVAVLWFAVGVVGLLPPVVAGHVSVGAWHDLATDAVVWHVPAGAVWVGALVALRAFLRRPGAERRERVLRRYHRLSTVCLVVLVLSGAVVGLVTAGLGGLWSGYGLLLAVKVAVCAVVPLLRRRWGASRPLGAELVVLGVAVGASVGLTHLVPPAWLVARPTVQETVLGYALPDPPSITGLLLGWRPDLVLGVGALLLAVAYLVGVCRLRSRGDGWPVGRAVAWSAGCAVVLVVTSSGLGRFAPGTFSLHMVSHMALNMLGPVLLVLGGPLTLALRALPPGPRTWLVALVHSRAARVVTHPVVAAVVFVASFSLLYFSDLFGEAMRYHWAHQVMNLHFLVSGYVFYWLVIGVDRAPRPLPHLARLGLLFSVMPFHAFFGVILMNTRNVIAETYYRHLSLPWVPDLLTDQRLGGGIAWTAGELPMLVVVIALLRQWAAADRREATRLDRHLDSDEDGRIAAYNAMLADLAGRRD
ncbi:putative copper resistance protein D [Saccharothrix texasensis]|uniref:Putative copper resistance protein D n=1 Tax=Saccharothrix texasensis TaxID=103734 RepID=A0A3N1GXC4_9PSEU|nr:putative copper resistance protein D [Saccharothrix texasensis]